MTGVLNENTYILYNTEKEGLIIDPGGSADKLLSAVKDLGLNVKYALLTHGHFDHCSAAAGLKEKGIKIVMHKSDIPILEKNVYLASEFGEKYKFFMPDYTVSDDEKIDFIGEKFTVLRTAGHTEGSVCYIVNDLMFSGDTLLYLSVGRTDMPSGNPEKMKKSLAKLFSLDKDYKIYPGHGMSTTLFFEKRHNPYV